IEQVREEAWPDVRDADELHDVLHTLIAFPVPASNHVKTGALAGLVERCSADCQLWFDHLRSRNRVVIALVDGRHYWIAAERAKAFSSIFSGARFEAMPPETGEKAATSDESLLALVTGWMSHIGPAQSSQLGELLGIPPGEIEKTMLRLE